MRRKIRPDGQRPEPNRKRSIIFYPPRLVIVTNRFPEPQLVLGLEIGLIILIPLRVYGFHMIWRNDVAALYLAIGQEFFCGHEGFCNNRIRSKGFAKNALSLSDLRPS